MYTEYSLVVIAEAFISTIRYLIGSKYPQKNGRP